MPIRNPSRGSRRSARWGLALIAVVWAIPNNEAAWWHDRIYDICMMTQDEDHDWECETRLVAPGE